MNIFRAHLCLQFGAVFAKKQLAQSLPKKIKLLKILTQPGLGKYDRLRAFHKANRKNEVSRKVLDHLQVTEVEYMQMFPSAAVTNSGSSNSKSETKDSPTNNSST